MSSSYLRQILEEHYSNPVNAGKPDKYTHTYSLINRSCGDEITVYLNISNGKITAINYEATGCAISIATSSILSEELANLETSQLKEKDLDFVQELIGVELSANRAKCALLPLQAIQKSINPKN